MCTHTHTHTHTHRSRAYADQYLAKSNRRARTGAPPRVVYGRRWHGFGDRLGRLREGIERGGAVHPGAGDHDGEAAAAGCDEVGGRAGGYAEGMMEELVRVVGDWLERELAWAQDEGPGGVCGWVCGGAGGAGGSVCGRCIRKVFWLLVALPQGLPDPRGCRWGWRGRDAGAHQQTSEVGRLDVGVDERVMGLGSQVVMLCGRARARLVSRASQPGKPAAGGRPGGGCLASRGEALAVAEVDVLREAAKCVMQEVGGFGGGGRPQGLSIS